MLLLLTIAHAQEAWREEVEVATIVTETESAVRARFYVPAPPERILELLADVPSYPRVLPPITKASYLSPEVVHLTIALPWPMSPRDSVSRVSQVGDGEAVLLHWAPTPGPPPLPGVVRLDASHGYWRVEPRAEGSWVTYESYNTAPANVPEPILRAIHRAEGHRLARNLRAAVAEP